MSTLSERINKALEEEIDNLKQELDNREKMKERLKTLNDDQLNSYLGIVKWYYRLQMKAEDGKS